MMSSEQAAVAITEQSPQYFGWRVLLASVVGMALSPGPLFWGSLGLFVMALQAEFGWLRSEIMLALVWVTIASIPAMPLVGRLIDQFGVRRVLLPSIVLLISILAIIPIVLDGLLTLYLLFFLAGFLTVGTQSISYIRVLSSWFDRHRGLSIGITAAGIGLGYAIIPPIVQWAIEGYGWRGGYWALAGLVAVVVLPTVILFIHNEPAPHSTNDLLVKATKPTGLSLFEALQKREFWVIAVCILMVATMFNAMLPTMAPLLIDRGMERASAVAAVSVMGIAMAVSRVLIGFLMDRLFAPKVAFIAFLLASGGLILLAFSGTSFAVFIAAFLIGLGFGAETDLMGYLVGRYFGLRAFGQIYGVILGVFLVGTGVGPYLYSIAYEYQGNYQQILIIGAVVGVVAATMFRLLRAYPQLTPISILAK